MLKKNKFFWTIVLQLALFGFSILHSQVLNKEEQTFYDLLTKHRKQNGIQPAKIPLSPSLTYVAKTHAIDLAINKQYGGECSIHSWSNNGIWTPCCYKGGENAPCMWYKPRELTKYTAEGYEISNSLADPEQGAVLDIRGEAAFNALRNSPSHNAVMLNQGPWAGYVWKAIGLGIYKGHACIWFGGIEEK